MARIRTIKPEFFTSEDIVSLSPLARLFYVSLWCEADREGRLKWRPKTLKMRYLPGDDCNIDQLALELIDSGLIVTYAIDDEVFAIIPEFTRHQVINNRETHSTIPSPDDSRVIDVSARVKAEGKEGKGKEWKGMEVASREREPTPKAKPPASIQKPDDVSEQTWADWVQLRKGHKAAITETVIKAAQSEAIKAGMPLDQFMTVWCLRGSRGLEASWLKPHERGLPVIARINGADPNAEAKRLLGFDDQGTIDA